MRNGRDSGPTRPRASGAVGGFRCSDHEAQKRTLFSGPDASAMRTIIGISLRVGNLDLLTQIDAICDMPTLTATKTVRLSRSRLAAAGPILERLGLDSRSAIEMFLGQVVSRKAIPFSVALPDSEYAAAEYALTAVEVSAAGKRMRRASDVSRRLGRVRAVTGIDSLRE